MSSLKNMHDPYIYKNIQILFQKNPNSNKNDYNGHSLL